MLDETRVDPAVYASSEWFVVAALMRGTPFLVSEICKVVKDGDFLDPYLQVAFRAILALHTEGITPTMVTVRQQLAIAYADSKSFAPSEAQESASMAYSRLTAQDGVTHTKTALFHAKRVAAVSTIRAVDRHLSQMRAECAESLQSQAPEQVATDLVARVQHSSMGLLVGRSRRTDSLLQNKLVAHEEQLWIDYAKAPGEVSGMYTGFKFLNDLTDGYQPGDYILIAAETSGGKTALALDLVRKSAKASNASWHIFSYEMGDKKLLNRMVWAESQIDRSRYRQKMLTPMEEAQVKAAYQRLMLLPPQHVHTDPTYTLSDIAAICRESKFKGECHGVMVDYLQLIPSDMTSANREREVASISRGLKNLAMELQIPVINLSQLNDEGKVRESRTIKQDADIMIRVSIDEESDSMGLGYKTCTLDFEKMRDEAKCKARLFFFGSQTRFVEEEEHFGRIA